MRKNPKRNSIKNKGNPMAYDTIYNRKNTKRTDNNFHMCGESTYFTVSFGNLHTCWSHSSAKEY